MTTKDEGRFVLLETYMNQLANRLYDQLVLEWNPHQSWTNDMITNIVQSIKNNLNIITTTWADMMPEIDKRIKDIDVSLNTMISDVNITFYDNTESILVFLADFVAVYDNRNTSVPNNNTDMLNTCSSVDLTHFNQRYTVQKDQ